MKRVTRRAAKVDHNQSEIVSLLRDIPGCSVEPGHDDILVGYRGRTFWFEIKIQDCVSNRTGKVKESSKKESQKKLEKEWTGHYRIVSTFDEILKEITK